jgi:hypothetical protein
MKALRLTAISVLVLAIFAVQAVLAQAWNEESQPCCPDFEIFGSWVYQYDRDNLGNDNGVRLNKSWLILNQELSDNTKAVVFLGLKGQNMLVHDFRIHWNPPLLYVDEITAGRFIPPFGYEYPAIRYDLLPTIYYSGINDSLIARDNGVRVDIGYRWAKLKLGLFAGDQRAGGFVEERKDNKLHAYKRLELELPYGFMAGASYRYARNRDDLVGVDSQWLYGGTEVTYEVIRFDGENQWYLMLVQQVHPLVQAVVRYENLSYGNRFIPGVKVELDNADIKFNYVLSGEKNGKNIFLGQMVVYFDF